MHFRAIVFISALAVVIQFCFAEKLHSGSKYHLSNQVDKKYQGYLTAEKNGEHCKKRADVITTVLSRKTRRAQEWRYIEKKGKYFLVAPYGNEVTMENVAPYCNSRKQAYKVMHFKGDQYRIQNLKTKKCLTAKGYRKRITWTRCTKIFRKAKQQRWTFTKVH